MPPEDYDARSLALPTESRPPLDRRPSSPFWTRPSTFRRPTTSSRTSGHSYSGSGSGTWWKRTERDVHKYSRRAWKTYTGLTLLQKAGVVLLLLLSVAISILVLVYNETIFAWLAGFAQKWRDVRAGWLILFALAVLVAFPPLIGYSTLLSLAGFVYGFPGGWPIIASATVLGSTLSFIACRTLFASYAARLAARDARFVALSNTIAHDGLKLLVLIRFCPLPYSFSNGAISTIPSVRAPQFALATALATPKLLVHVFVGSRLAALAEDGGDMDLKTKVISWASIVLGSVAGVATGWIIYRQTQRRARELELEERDRRRAEYADDPEALADDSAVLREDDDDISLENGEDWLEDDSFVDDDDAQDLDVGVTPFGYRDESPGAFSSEDEDKKAEGRG